MDCFNDFCLNCDKQCSDGPYCSQSCRLADLEKGTSSNPSSPLSAMTGSHYSSNDAWNASHNNAKRTHPVNIHSRSTSSPATTNTSSSHESGRLTPSSSRTSLTSTASSSGANGLTEQARIELQDYFSSFDQTRAAKRRSSVR